MNELQEYTASIPDSNPNKAELIRQWKIENKWGQQEVKEAAVKLPFEKLKEDVGIVEETRGTDIKVLWQVPIKNGFDDIKTCWVAQRSVEILSRA